MKKWLVAGAIALVGTQCWAGNSLVRPIATVTKVSGIVELNDGTNWSPAIEGSFLYPESRIRADAAGLAEIRFREGCQVKLASGTELTLKGAQSQNSFQAINLISGKILVSAYSGGGLDVNTDLGSAKLDKAEAMVGFSNYKEKLTIVALSGAVQTKSKNGNELNVRKSQVGILSSAMPPVALPVTTPVTDFEVSNFKATEQFRADVWVDPSGSGVDSVTPVQIKLVPVSPGLNLPYSNRVVAKSFQPELGVSATQGNFESSVELMPSNGVATVYVRATKPGAYRLTIGGRDFSPVQQVISIGKNNAQVATDTSSKVFTGTLTVNGFSHDIEVFIDPVSKK